MKFDKLFEYQTTDLELVKIERALSSSAEKDKAAQLDGKMKAARDSMAKMNAEADELSVNAEKLASSISEYESEALEVAAHLSEVGDFNEIEYYEKILANLSDDVQKLERELNRINSQMDYIKEGSDKLTRQTVQVNEQYKAAVQTYQALKQKLQNEGRPIMEKLKVLEKDVPEHFLVTYKRCRANRKLPVFVEYKGDGSCFCGMNLPNDCVAKLKEEGDWVECPNCGRMVLVNK